MRKEAVILFSHCKFRLRSLKRGIETTCPDSIGKQSLSWGLLCCARNDAFKMLLIILIAHVSYLTSLHAQDTHYSQYFNVPLSLNPALTGKMDGTYRVGFDYRNQWFGLTNDGSTYSTPSFFGDVPIRFKNKDILGVGLNIVNDRSSGGRLSNFSGVISLAYHKAMGKTKNHFFSFGLQGGLLQKKLDLANIRLADQIFLQNENITNTSSDNLQGSDGGFDMNAGFDWSSKFSEKVSMNAGYAAMHLLQPEISFALSNDKLPMRHVINVGADFSFSKHFGLLPFFTHMTQAKATESYFGLAMDFGFTNDVSMQLGGYYRIEDAVVPYLGFDIKGMKLGVSYDFTASDLQNTSGGIEISIVYIGKYVAVPDVKPSLYCPRF
ncbi:MAG: PorP/SprF family type IX secretion system membrane protein [Chitinophagales bacterium]|nr:PorP/SprF family type IX secretion system membrane protein [Chitinophagales bacterium]